MKKLSLRILPVALSAAFAGHAAASSFQVWEQNASGIGTAFAGSAAVADDASTNFFNPAGLTRLSGFQLSAGVVGARASTQFGDGGSTNAANGNGGDAGRFIPLANLYVSSELTRDLYFGFGVSSPYAASNRYNGTWAGNAQAQSAELKSVNVNPSLAYRVGEKLSLGFGLNVQKLDMDVTNTTYRFKGDSTAAGWNAGALFTLSPAMRVGVSYRSGIKHSLEGGGNKAELKTPSTFILSVWQQVSDRWEAMGDLSYTRWSNLRQMTTYNAAGAVLGTENFDYRDAWRFAWGAAYKADDVTKVKFGVAYDRAPTSSNNTNVAMLPEGHALWLTLGGQLAMGAAGKVDVGYAYKLNHDASIRQTVGADTLAGSFQKDQHVLGVQYSVGF